MDVNRPTQAEGTTTVIQEAAQAGFPVLIPGAWEVRGGRPVSRTPGAVTVSQTRRPQPAGHDRARLEREREGGGAPSERSPARRRTLLSRIGNRILRGI